MSNRTDRFGAGNSDLSVVDICSGHGPPEIDWGERGAAGGKS